jgi:hypothetical protein
MGPISIREFRKLRPAEGRANWKIGVPIVKRLATHSVVNGMERERLEFRLQAAFS